MREWGQRNRASPQIISAVLHVIFSWWKVNTSYPTNPLSIAVAISFENQTIICWIQSIMGILSNNWSKIENLHLQSLGAKTSDKIWISLLIGKMWYVAWDFCNFRNHTIHATDGPIKLEIIEFIIKRVTCHLEKRSHLEKGSIGLPTRCFFLFHTSIHTLIVRPIRQDLFWMSVTTIIIRCLRTHASRIRLPDTYELLLGIITTGILITFL